MFDDRERPLTISPITRTSSGGYTWEADGQAYWTDSAGQGLFTSTYSERKDSEGNIWVRGDHNHQLLGTCQFAVGHLSPSARRRRVIAWAVRSRVDYGAWLSREGRSDTVANAVDYYKLYLKQG